MSKKDRSITLDLTKAAREKLDQFGRQSGMTVTEIFRFAFTLLRIYYEARQQGKRLVVIDPNNENAPQIWIELPYIH